MVFRPNGIADHVPDDAWVDAVFDIRTANADGKPLTVPNGHFVIAKPAQNFDNHTSGEGDPSRFMIVRCRLDQLPQFQTYKTSEAQLRVRGGTTVYEEYLPTGQLVVKPLPLGTVPRRVQREEQVPVPVARLAIESMPKIMPIAPGAKLGMNVLHASALQYATPTTEEEYNEKSAQLDTRKNAILTVGTGKTYATISAAVTAASSGDTIAVYANATNTYTENVDASFKLLQIIGMVPNRGVTITAASGTVVKFSVSVNSGGSYFDNFKVVATGTAGIGIDAWYAAYALVISDIEAVGGTTAAIRGYISTRLINCLARDAAVGFWTDQLVTFLNCTAVDNTTYGFQGGTGAHCIMCIGAGNGTADFYQIGSRTYLNASADGSAPGAGSVTGFFTTDFVDYANDDFRLKAAVAGTTLARFDGYPLHPLDGYNQVRKRGGIVFAGFHDPDPELSVADVISAKTLIGVQGTYHEATTAEVQKDVAFGPASGYTGLYVTAIPAKPTVVIKSVASGTVTLTLSGVVGTAYAYYRKGTSGTWSAKSESWKLIADGDLAITGLDNDCAYAFMAQNEDGVPSRIAESDIVWTSPTAGTKTAAGALSLPMENLRTLLANSAHFQSWVGVADAESAKAHIYIAAIDGADVVTSRPFAMITNVPGQANFDSNAVAGGGRMHFFDTGSLYLWFESAIATADQSSHQDAHFVFLNNAGEFVDDMKTLAGSGSYMAVTDFKVVNGPVRAAKEEQTEYYQIVFEVSYE